MKRLALMFLVVTGLLAMWSAPALAHNSLVEALPAKDAVLAQPPAEVKLRFLATLGQDTKLTVTDASGTSAIGAVTISGKFLSAPFTASAPGTYTVTYELMSEDGHPIKNSYIFGIAAPPPPSTPTDAPAAVMTLTAAAPDPPVAESKQDTPWFPYIGGAALAGLAVGALLAFLKRRRDSPR